MEFTTTPPPYQPLQVHKLSQEEMDNHNAFESTIIVMGSFPRGINAKNKKSFRWMCPNLNTMRELLGKALQIWKYRTQKQCL
jgi:hypothetical protein